MSKSHVGMGFSLCPICRTRHDEVVLLDRFIRDRFEPESFMGWALCPKHEAMKGEYLALVETTGPARGDTLKPGEANHTGQIMHMRRTVVKQVFNMDIPNDLPMVFVEVGVIDKIKAMTGESHE